MTHDELLAKIDNKLKYIRDQIELTENVPLYIEGDMDRLHTERAALLALRAVVELHKPEITSFDLGPKYLACSHCIESTNDHDYQVDYPCQTIHAIEAELYA